MLSGMQMGVDLISACPDPERGVISGPTALLPPFPMIQIINSSSSSSILSIPYTHNTHNLSVVPSYNLRILNPDWDTGVDCLVKEIMEKMRCHMFNMSVRLNRLEVQVSSGKKEEQQVEQDSRKFATLVIQVPSIYTGGKMQVCDLGESGNGLMDCNLGHDGSGVEGVEMHKSALAYYYMCYFEGKRIYQEDIKSGARIFIYYDILWNEEIRVPKCVGSLRESAFVCMKETLSEWRMEEKMALYPFENLYSNVQSEEPENFKSDEEFFAYKPKLAWEIDGLNSVDHRVANLFSEIAQDCDVKIYLLACFKKEVHSSNINCHTYDDKYFRNVLNQYLDSLDWNIIDTSKQKYSQTLFELDGKQLPVDMKLPIDNGKLCPHGVAILNPGRMDTLCSKKGTYLCYREYPPRRYVYYEHYALLVIPNSNLFEVLLNNGGFDFAIESVNVFSESQLITILARIEKSPFEMGLINSVFCRLLQSSVFLDSLKNTSLIAPLIDIMLGYYFRQSFIEYLMKKELGLLRILIEVLGIDLVYDWVLIECVSQCTCNPLPFLDFLLYSEFFIKDKFSGIITACSGSLLSSITSSNYKELDDVFAIVDYLTFYCTDEDVNSQVLKCLLEKNRRYKKQIFNYFRSIYSYKDFIKSEILKNVLDEHISFLKLEVLQIPKLSWKICTNRFPVKDFRLEEFFSGSKRKTVIRFDSSEECDNFLRENDMYCGEGDYDLIDYNIRPFSGGITDLLLAKTLEHFTSWKNQHESDSKELDELLAWMGIDRETFLHQNKSGKGKRGGNSKRKPSEGKRRKLEN
jgi:hypothetical protein